MNPVIDREKELREKMTETLIKHAAETAADEMLDELPPCDGDVVFSARHEENMRKLFESVKPEKKKILPLKRVLVLVAALVAIGGALSAVGRNPKVMNFFMKTTETNTEIRYEEAENAGDTYVTEDVTFGYIPEGMQMVKNEKGDRGITVTFKKSDQQFVFRMVSMKYIDNLDTQYADMEKIKIYNMDGYIQEKGENVAIHWYTEDYVYILQGNLEKEEVIKIVENIQ